ncbi:MAG: hypothetical protein WA826_00775, partial [Silvibacterium sp.]
MGPGRFPQRNAAQLGWYFANVFQAAAKGARQLNPGAQHSKEGYLKASANVKNLFFLLLLASATAMAQRNQVSVIGVGNFN